MYLPQKRIYATHIEFRGITYRYPTGKRYNCDLNIILKYKERITPIQVSSRVLYINSTMYLYYLVRPEYHVGRNTPSKNSPTAHVISFEFTRTFNIDILLRNSMRYTILSYFKQNIKEEIVLSKNSCQIFVLHSSDFLLL